MATEYSSVVGHYARDDLMTRIRGALEAAGHDPDKPTVEMLSGIDHLHGGGHATTEVQVELAGIARGSHVLDAGCGVGGPSRYLAHRHGCTVDAIDLTPEYVETARRLNELTGLNDRIRATVGSVTELPQDDGCFDAVLCQNVTMNVADKAAMFAEAFRVLKPGGIYTISHLAHGPGGPPLYPLPWALTPDVSFLETPEKIREQLAQAGFADIEDWAGRARSKPGDPPKPGGFDVAPTLGDNTALRLANSARSVKEGRLVAMMVVARRPG